MKLHLNTKAPKVYKRNRPIKMQRPYLTDRVRNMWKSGKNRPLYGCYRYAMYDKVFLFKVCEINRFTKAMTSCKALPISPCGGPCGQPG